MAVHHREPLLGVIGLALVAGCYLTHEREPADPIRPEVDAGPDAASSADAAAPPDGPPACWQIELGFMPTARAQIAVWLEHPESGGFRTLFLTEAVGNRGIGNRPGALQMNSGFRWPFGRRESVLPAWSHRRIAHGGAPFSRVVFQDRREGHASGDPEDSSPEEYFCLPFNADVTRRDGLDAVTCASPFHGDRGRYVTGDDVGTGYAEPFEDAPSDGRMRPLSLTSVYPPRRDLVTCAGSRCNDHPDSERFASDALAAMPEVDMVTAATPPADLPHTVRARLPRSWPAGITEVFVEVHTEGDYNEAFGPDEAPTPEQPEEEWDSWARNYGYPYRGQPSVVFRLGLELRGDSPLAATAEAPQHHTTVHGEDGTLLPIAGSAITDAPATAPGRGADRLRLQPGGSRVTASAARVPCP